VGVCNQKIIASRPKDRSNARQNLREKRIGQIRYQCNDTTGAAVPEVARGMVHSVSGGLYCLLNSRAGLVADQSGVAYGAAHSSGRHTRNASYITDFGPFLFHGSSYAALLDGSIGKAERNRLQTITSRG
jgi:hypothetical protein